MNALATLYHQRLALVDLAAGSARALPLPPDTLARAIGGPALALALAGSYPDAVIFAAGPLTGSFAPASGLLTASLPQANGETIHLALPLGHGAWLRKSGFDALVISGKGSPQATRQIIRCHRGSCTVQQAANGLPAGAGRMALRASLLRNTADGRAGLILADAPTGMHKSLPSAAGAEYGPLPGGALLAKALQERGIAALSLEGGSPLPPMPVALDNTLRQGLKNGRGTAKDALPRQLAKDALLRQLAKDALLRELADDCGNAVTLPAALRWKSAACYHCPSPCLAWVEVEGGRHLLAADHAALAVALAAFGADAPACLGLCDAQGLDCEATASLLHGTAGKDLAAALAVGIHAAAAPTAKKPTEITDAMKAGLILGICPRLIRREPALAEACLGPKALPMLAGSALLPRLSEAVSLLTQRVFI